MTARGPLRIKSYFAKSVDQAMAQAREELGEEAMLLNSRKASVLPPEIDPAGTSGGGYEVIFGLAEEPSQAVVRAAPSPAVFVPAEKETAAPEHFASELERLNVQMDEIRSLIVRSSRAQAAIGRSVPGLAEVFAHLLSADVEPALSKDIVDRLEAAMGTEALFERGTAGRQPVNPRRAPQADPGRLEAFLRVELESRVGLAPRLGAGTGADDKSGTVVVLVGPPGAGKTTSIAKLAIARAKQDPERTPKLLSLDMSRAGAHLHLQYVANKFGIAFQEVPAAYLLPGLIKEVGPKETVFIDTPGYTGADTKAAEAAIGAFAECPALDVHLVVPGYMKARDLRLCIHRYAAFRPAKLLVTKLDETNEFGSIFSEAARAGLKLSFVSHGPSVAHDIRPASHEDLMGMALGRDGAGAQCVA